MKNRSILLSLLFVLIPILAPVAFRTAAAPIVVTKQVAENPTIHFAGIPGQPELSRAVAEFLGVCGWFDRAADAAKADYLLVGSISGETVTFDLSIGGAPVGQWRFRLGGDPRRLAKSAVDALIEKSFKDLKVRGFCHTRIAFCAETAPGIRNIYLCDIDGGDVKQLTRYRAACVEPAWTPGGRSVCYSKYGNSSISVIETLVAPPHYSRVLSSFNGINTGAAVSPDGKLMAVILSFDHKVDLYVREQTTRRLRRLTKGIAVEASPCWSPDGREIAYVSDEGGAPRIWIVGAAGGNRRRIPTIGADAVTPDWSGDGQIVFASRVGGAYTLGVHDLKTGRTRRVTNAPGIWESPSWAPDNRQVVCKRTEGGRSALYVVDTRTGRVRRLLATGWNLSTPAWSPGRPAESR